MASDAASACRMPGRRPANPNFVWVSSSPSPAEIAALEARYPAVVQVPVLELEAESIEWLRRAVLMRTFHKWVPAEAFLREFRRAGIAGEISQLSMAHRCHIFRFADGNARDAVLNRPWTINGQPVAAEAWKPEFIPTADSVPMALLWIRLPNLPIEFWKEESLKEIVGPAGQFMFADEATLAKNRGGYARACVRVDLRSPLRPGTRLRGLHGPFWQQFSFENLEGICNSCGSLHLAGACSSPATPASDSSSDGVRFGPWMSVIRQRKAYQGPLPASRGNHNSNPVSATSDPHPDGSPPLSAPGTVDGSWSVPQKLTRRRGRRRIEVLNSVKEAVGQASAPLSFESTVAQTVAQRAGSSAVAKIQLSGVSDIQLSETDSPPIQLTKNPFATLMGVLDAISPPGSRDACPGPLKRARPTEYQAPRSIPKKDSQKSKGSVHPLKIKNLKSTSSDYKAVVPGSPSGCLAKGPEAMKIQSPRTSDSNMDLPDKAILDQESGSMSSDLLNQNEESQVLIMSSPQPPENAMVEDREVTLVPHSVK